MQWLIGWMGDLPDEAEYYLKRTDGWWGALLIIACLLFAIVPFFVLLREKLRARLGELRNVAWMILAGYVLETIWRLAPAFTPNPLIVISVMLIGWIAWLILRRPLPEAGLV
jgi:hypothetical protein